MIELEKLILVQSLYKYEFSNRSEDFAIIIDEIITSYNNGDIAKIYDIEVADFKEIDNEFFNKIVALFDSNIEEIDSIISTNLKEGWNIKSLPNPLLAILRAGAFDLLFFSDNKNNSNLINQYISIAKQFYEKSEIGFVNAMLDKISKRQF